MPTQVDYLIIGAGPAGLQMGYYLERGGRSYLILEAGDKVGKFFDRFPRHRRLISINKVYTGYNETEINLRWDWNSLLSDDDEMLFRRFSENYWPAAEDYVSYLGAFAERFALKVKLRTRVTRVCRAGRDGVFQVFDEEGGEYLAQRLIVATGVSRPYLPPISGIDLVEQYVDVSVDPRDFINQRVLILGKGNSGFETAENLIGTAAVIHLASPEPLSMAWQTHYVGHLRAINNTILDSYQLKSQNAVLDASVDRIEPRGNGFLVSFHYTHANNEREQIYYDRVISCTGFRFDPSIFDQGCLPALVIKDRFPEQTCEWESVNIPDLYFAGTLMQVRDYRKVTSAFIHGFRYTVRALYRMLERKYHGKPWPSRRIELDPEALMRAVIDRVNSTSGLWQLFGFLGDLIVVDDSGASFYEELPLDYIHSSDFGRNDQYYVLTLEYGPNHDQGNPFAVERIARDDVDRADRSNFLHPVVRELSRGRLLREHHIIEDLAAEWKEDVHTQPLLGFFRSTVPRPLVEETAQ